MILASQESIEEFLDNLTAYKYEYKDEMKENPLAGKGEFISPMAQDLEKSKLGAKMVVDTSDGKIVDYGKGFGTMLASQAFLNKRLNEIEEELKDKKKDK